MVQQQRLGAPWHMHWRRVNAATHSLQQLLHVCALSLYCVMHSAAAAPGHPTYLPAYLGACVPTAEYSSNILLVLCKSLICAGVRGGFSCTLCCHGTPTMHTRPGGFRARLLWAGAACLPAGSYQQKQGCTLPTYLPACMDSVAHAPWCNHRPRRPLTAGFLERP